MKYFNFLLGCFWLLIIDLITKYLFYDMAYLPQIREATFNTGISFSISINQIIVEIITIAFIIWIWIFYYNQKVNAVVAGLLIAGALGNLIDRILLGWVRDFIWLGFGPVFNMADIYITFGTMYLILFSRPWA